MVLTTNLLNQLKVSLPDFESLASLTEADLVESKEYPLSKEDVSNFLSDRVIFLDQAYYDSFQGSHLTYKGFLIQGAGELYTLFDDDHDDHIVAIEWGKQGATWTPDLQAEYDAIKNGTTVNELYQQDSDLPTGDEGDGLLDMADLELAGTTTEPEPSDLGPAPLPEDLGEQQPFLSVVDE